MNEKRTRRMTQKAPVNTAGTAGRGGAGLASAVRQAGRHAGSKSVAGESAGWPARAQLPVLPSALAPQALVQRKIAAGLLQPLLGVLGVALLQEIYCPPDTRNRKRKVTAPMGVFRKSLIARILCGSGRRGRQGGRVCAPWKLAAAAATGRWGRRGKQRWSIPSSELHSTWKAHQRQPALEVLVKIAGFLADSEFGVKLGGRLAGGARRLRRLGAHLILSIHLQARPGSWQVLMSTSSSHT